MASPFLGLVGNTPQQGHPLIPLLQVAEPNHLAPEMRPDVDYILDTSTDADLAHLFDVLSTTVDGRTLPTANTGGFVDFQLSRGLLGVST